MKIVFFIGTFNFGGAEKHALMLADYYKNKLGWHTEVWGWSELNGSIPDRCNEINVSALIVPQWKYKNFFERKKLEIQYKKLLNNVDVLMSFNNKVNIFCAEFIPFTKVKLHVWAQQGIDGYSFPKQNQQKAIKNVKCVISNSKNGISFLTNEVGFRKEVCHLVHNGIDTNLPQINSDNWSHTLGVPSANVFSAIMLANITKLKDHPTLIKAWKIVKNILEKKGIIPKLYLAGRKDNMYEESLNLCKSENLEDNIFFLGPVKDVYNLVSLMDLAILSSPSEGLPNAVLEVMLLGKPFVGTNIPGIREAVGEHNYKFLAKEKDIYSLAEIIIDFALNSEKRKQVGNLNKIWVENNFPIEKLCQDTHKLILEHLKF